VSVIVLNRFDDQLHQLILQTCGNATIQRILQGLRDKIWLIRRRARPPRLQKSVTEHLQIIEKIKNHDGDGAEKAMIAHIQAMKEDFHNQW
jgi:DNA-binding GntR family transcriptional regulator